MKKENEDFRNIFLHLSGKKCASKSLIRLKLIDFEGNNSPLRKNRYIYLQYQDFFSVIPLSL